MNDQLANAIIASLFRKAGIAELVLSAEDVRTLSEDPIRIEGLATGNGFRVCLVPNDPVLLARLALGDVQAAARHPNKQVRAQLEEGARTAYGSALALLTPEQLVTFAGLAAKPVTDEERAYQVPVTDASTPTRRGVIALVRD